MRTLTKTHPQAASVDPAEVTTVLVVDDHQAVRLGIQMLLDDEPGIEGCLDRRLVRSSPARLAPPDHGAPESHQLDRRNRRRSKPGRHRRVGDTS